jgi:LysR family transcriptional regulator, benzoate and cis,cis-muconate-responsive activator of ben and cat genes
VDLRHLRSFVAVAEELHFSRAAQRLNLAQSAVSAQVRKLEREVGGALLVRTSRRVLLTPAGEALLEDARALLAAADDALARARGLARGETGTLVVGCFGPSPGELLATLLDRFQAHLPDVRVEVSAFDFAEVLERLRDGRLDVSFLYLPLDEPDIHVTPLLNEPRVVVMAADHPLARRESLRPEDLAGETFVTQPQSMPLMWRDFWMLVDQLGERPQISPHVAPGMEQWLHQLARGDGIDTAPAIVDRFYSWPGIACVPLEGAPPATLALARMADSDDPAVAAFERVTLDVLGVDRSRAALERA